VLATARSASSLSPPAACPGCWVPSVFTSWQIQFSGALDASLNASLYEIDLFDTPSTTVDALHAGGHRVVCYVDAGTWESFRPDAATYPDAVKGRPVAGFPDERWLDIRQLAVLQPILSARLDQCQGKGFDGVDFDNVDGYANDTGFPLTADDQLAFDTWLANAAHARGLSVALKNDLDQIPDLLPYFDWAVNEQCFQYGECDKLVPFVQAGKAVLEIEYRGGTRKFCPAANARSFNAMRKHRSLDAYRVQCNAGVESPPPPCALFPADNVWNADVSTLPVHSLSDAYVASIGTTAALHPDFGTIYNGAPNGIPYAVLSATQTTVPVTFQYGDESDPGPYPIPPDAPIEGGPRSRGDRHVLVLQAGTCRLFELFDARPLHHGRSWKAGSGATWDLGSDALRPATFTSADAAGLPILPGLVRYDEVAGGAIRHALRVTVPRTQRAFLWPARHQAGSSTDPSLPPMGLRLRLKATVDISGFSPANQVILTALKRYGMFVADNGAPWFVTGAPDPRWDDDDLHQLGQIVGADFEAVDESQLMADPDSGRVP
jgi:glycosyl hydrolase family 114